MAVTLGVPRQRLLLLREEAELRADATVGELGLGIADIIGESRDLAGAAALEALLNMSAVILCRVCCHGSRGPM